MIERDAKTSVCFSGHRRVAFDMDAPHFQRILTEAVEDAINMGYENFYTGMAQGFDIVAAEAVLRARYNHANAIKLHCIIPYRGQENRWSEKWLKCHDNVLKAADSIVCLNPVYTTGCYHERNRYLVEHASLLICLYSGKAGGTRHTFGYAEQKGLEIVNLWDRLGDY